MGRHRSSRGRQVTGRRSQVGTGCKDMTENSSSFSIYTGPESEERLAPESRNQPQTTKNQTSDDEDASDEDSVYYFGVGPIVHPDVRKRQGVKVNSVQAAVLPEYRITFAVGGVANAVVGRGCEIHGLVMKFDTRGGWDEFRKSINAGANALRLVKVYPYASPEDPIRAYIFVMNEDGSDLDAPMEQPASERYLRLIADGLRQHKVDDEYIDHQIMSVEFVEARKPGNYRTFPCKTKDETLLPTITFRKYEQMCQRTCKSKSSTTKTYYFILGRYVFEMPVPNEENPGAQWIKSKCHGRSDSTWTLHQILVDPYVPVADSPDDLTPLHTEWAEQMGVEYLERCGLSATKCYRLVTEVEKRRGLLSMLCCRR